MIKIGNVCECKHGKLGVVTSVSETLYKGIGIDGTSWQSKDPKLVAGNIIGLVSDCQMDSVLAKKIIES